MQFKLRCGHERFLKQRLCQHFRRSVDLELLVGVVLVFQVCRYLVFGLLHHAPMLLGASDNRGRLPAPMTLTDSCQVRYRGSRLQSAARAAAQSDSETESPLPAVPFGLAVRAL